MLLQLLALQLVVGVEGFTMLRHSVYLLLYIAYSLQTVVSEQNIKVLKNTVSLGEPPEVQRVGK